MGEADDSRESGNHNWRWQLHGRRDRPSYWGHGYKVVIFVWERRRTGKGTGWDRRRCLQSAAREAEAPRGIDRKVDARRLRRHPVSMIQ